MEKIIVDELGELSEVDTAAVLNSELADSYTKHFFNSPKRFTLFSPVSITVVRGGKFSKQAHIGGEQFTPFAARIGAKGGLIYSFKPYDAASYQHAEMSHGSAIKTFGADFSDYLKQADVGEIREEIEKEEAKKHEASQAVQNGVKAERYAGIGWGEF